ncbi:MAG: hypothetical protein AABX12_03580 [Nanoarchaeota archaeon]
MNGIDKLSETSEESGKQDEGKLEGSKWKREAILEKTGREYFSAGEDELKKERYNSSVVLFFKALTSFSDLYLLKNIGKSPSSHADRFRLTKERFPEVYEILDKDFPFYQESYNAILSRELAEKMKNDAETVARKAKIEI